MPKHAVFCDSTGFHNVIMNNNNLKISPIASIAANKLAKEGLYETLQQDIRLDMHSHNSHVYGYAGFRARRKLGCGIPSGRHSGEPFENKHNLAPNF